MEVTHGSRIYKKIGGGGEGDVWSTRKEDDLKDFYTMIRELVEATKTK